MLQRDHDHVVAHLDLVAAARDQDLMAAGDAAQQQILFQVQLAQGDTGGSALLVDGNSSASTRSSRMRYSVLMLLPASFCSARTYCTM